MLACFLVPLWEVINLSFAIEAGHLVRLPCPVGILPFTLSQCHTGNDTVWGMEEGRKKKTIGLLVKKKDNKVDETFPFA